MRRHFQRAETSRLQSEDEIPRRFAALCSLVSEIARREITPAVIPNPAMRDEGSLKSRSITLLRLCDVGSDWEIPRSARDDNVEGLKNSALSRTIKSADGKSSILSASLLHGRPG